MSLTGESRSFIVDFEDASINDNSTSVIVDFSKSGADVAVSDNTHSSVLIVDFNATLSPRCSSPELFSSPEPDKFHTSTSTSNDLIMHSTPKKDHHYQPNVQHDVNRLPSNVTGIACI